jgi:hypothetical protein
VPTNQLCSGNDNCGTATVAFTETSAAGLVLVLTVDQNLVLALLDAQTHVQTVTVQDTTANI